MSSETVVYPKRPPYFSHRFCRLLFKACVANDIGPSGCWLLTVIAHTEDAKGYRGAVSFFNMQLAPLVGLGSVDALDAVRKKAIGAGWLHYTPGAKGVAGRYWVMIPEHYRGVDDAPTDENPAEYAPGFVRENAEVSPKKAGDKSDTSAFSRKHPRGMHGSNREECTEHSSLSLSQDKDSAAVAAVATIDKKPAEKKKAAPKEKKPREPEPLFEALIEATGADRKKDRGFVAKIRNSLAGAERPFTADDVREFAQRWRDLLPWAKPADQPRLTLGIIHKHIQVIRAAGRSPPVEQCRPQASDIRAADDAARGQIIPPRGQANVR